MLIFGQNDEITFKGTQGYWRWHKLTWHRLYVTLYHCSVLTVCLSYTFSEIITAIVSIAVHCFIFEFLFFRRLSHDWVVFGLGVPGYGGQPGGGYGGPGGGYRPPGGPPQQLSAGAPGFTGQPGARPGSHFGRLIRLHSTLKKLEVDLKSTTLNQNVSTRLRNKTIHLKFPVDPEDFTALPSSSAVL